MGKDLLFSCIPVVDDLTPVPFAPDGVRVDIYNGVWDTCKSGSTRYISSIYAISYDYQVVFYPGYCTFRPGNKSRIKAAVLAMIVLIVSTRVVNTSTSTG